MSSPPRRKKLVFPRFPEDGPNADLYSYDYPPLPAAAGTQNALESDFNAHQDSPAADESPTSSTETSSSEWTDDDAIATTSEVPRRRRSSPPPGMELDFSLEEEETGIPVIIIPVSRPSTCPEPIPLPAPIYGPVQRSSSRNREQRNPPREALLLVLPRRGRDSYPNVLAKERRGVTPTRPVQFPWQSRVPYTGRIVRERSRQRTDSMSPPPPATRKSEERHPSGTSTGTWYSGYDGNAISIQILWHDETAQSIAQCPRETTQSLAQLLLTHN
ncbi:hypothetical protein Ptr902_07402 [Pyrenophora tritici-repentis]|uniref:Uncharacterized protein n=1 Tax=Pyrenophora tritici-repentis (strain Pt-1C-BFP) TaxID=426418 RepID=B2W3K4_PYRTR|nr:uncharacterized protein PTRG_05054 [Pyrenophora tritici-repentis Pt-1C-BFP]KAI0581177.1 hypothetical protein Alg130_06734 [Pyrenophora tritici-repentis]EDU47961.1 predicted protein [Pyrenophora tritici-repentis Pt-1C-BFP]KAI0609278.1 hypothetical protein TUN205_06494 [Pyrenophora tritici-repentis]KAI0621368.1 hypothetical protein TUN199_06659 [Pyrenophora tritici-repentis]KAI1528835.1 hypothetical protein PtrSN001A_008821 [Pyrenophora tritici-repentis]